MLRTPRLGIVSYCDHLRTYAHVNHQYYAEKHGYTYINDISPTHHTPFKNKIEKLLKLMDLFDYVFWIDDDAFFLQYDKPLTDFITRNKKYSLIYCKSPVNEGKWTYLSSGNFFMKSNRKTREFLERCLTAELDDIRPDWNETEEGLFTNGDQDIMVHLLKRDSAFSSPRFHICLPYENFNTRPFHFKKKSNEHFLVHFTGNNKQQQALEFAKKFKLSPALIPQEAFDAYHGKGHPGQTTGFAD